jgi:hypothetical protein
VGGPPARITVESPLACLIRVRGELDPAWSDRLGGLRPTVVRAEGAAAGGAVATELRGEVRDQASLLGVLTALSDLGVSLLDVVCTPRPPRPRA